MKHTMLGLLILLSIATVFAQQEGAMITAPGEAFGHHGNCYGWNACGNAETCALWACEAKGYKTLVSYGAEKPCTEFANCNLFRSRGDVQYNWGNWCQVMGVTDIVCTDGNGQSNGENGSNVPEFGLAGAALATIGILAFVYARKK